MYNVIKDFTSICGTTADLNSIYTAIQLPTYRHSTVKAVCQLAGWQATILNAPSYSVTLENMVHLCGSIFVLCSNTLTVDDTFGPVWKTIRVDPT